MPLRSSTEQTPVHTLRCCCSSVACTFKDWPACHLGCGNSTLSPPALQMHTLSLRVRTARPAVHAQMGIEQDLQHSLRCCLSGACTVKGWPACHLALSRAGLPVTLREGDAESMIVYVQNCCARHACLCMPFMCSRRMQPATPGGAPASSMTCDRQHSSSSMHLALDLQSCVCVPGSATSQLHAGAHGMLLAVSDHEVQLTAC